MTMANPPDGEAEALARSRMPSGLLSSSIWARPIDPGPLKEVEMANTVVWLDIPVVDLDRAIKFYSSVLGSPVKKEQFPNGTALGLLPHEPQSLGGCLYQTDPNAV